MKHKIFLTFILWASSAMLFAQSDWQWQNPLPQANSLHDIAIVNVDVVAAAGGAAMTDAQNLWVAGQFEGILKAGATATSVNETVSVAIVGERRYHREFICTNWPQENKSGRAEWC